MLHSGEINGVLYLCSAISLMHGVDGACSMFGDARNEQAHTILEVKYHNKTSLEICAQIEENLF